MAKKKKLDEGIILLSSLMPKGKQTMGGMRTREDNFTFKGFPGQFKNGKKVMDDNGQTIKEDSYYSGAVDKFIKDNEEYADIHGTLPRIKVFGDKGDTKFLNVTYDALRQISKILKKMKI